MATLAVRQGWGGSSDVLVAMKDGGDDETACLGLRWGEQGWMGSEEWMGGEPGASVGVDGIISDMAGM